MVTRVPYRLMAGCLLTLMALAAPVAFGADKSKQLEAEVQQLKLEVSELKQLLQQQQGQRVSKEEVDALKSRVTSVEDASKAAAKQEEVAEVKKRVEEVREASVRPPYDWMAPGTSFNFGGYADIGYSSQRQGSRGFETASFNPIFNLLYRDLVLFSGELEISAQPDGETETGLEFANVNLFPANNLMITAGKFLSNLGQFSQNLHASWINKLASRPAGFTEDPGGAPLSDVGVAARGGFRLGDAVKMNYAAYVANAPTIVLNEAGDQVLGIDPKGKTTAPNNTMAYGGRLSIFPLPTLEFGVSGATGKVAAEGEDSRSYSVAGADFAYQFGRALDIRGEYIRQLIGNLEASPAPLGGTWTAWYTQAAYKFMPTKFEGVLRYGKFTSPVEDQLQTQWAFGLNYLFAPQLIGKLTYENNKGLTADTDTDRVLVQFTYGF